jgi:hypothetical protein
MLVSPPQRYMPAMAAPDSERGTNGSTGTESTSETPVLDLLERMTPDPVDGSSLHRQRWLTPRLSRIIPFA